MPNASRSSNLLLTHLGQVRPTEKGSGKNSSYTISHSFERETSSNGIWTSSLELSNLHQPKQNKTPKAGLPLESEASRKSQAYAFPLFQVSLEFVPHFQPVHLVLESYDGKRFTPGVKSLEENNHSSVRY